MHSLRTYLLQALADPAARDAAGPEALAGAENLCHQAIFMNHASHARSGHASRAGAPGRSRRATAPARASPRTCGSRARPSPVGARSDATAAQIGQTRPRPGGGVDAAAWLRGTGNSNGLRSRQRPGSRYDRKSLACRFAPLRRPSRAPAGRGKLITSAFAQVSGLSSDRQSAEVLFEKYALSSALSRIRTCAHDSGVRRPRSFSPAPM